MQTKDLTSLRSKVSSQPTASPDAVLLPQELAAQLKSGTARPSDTPLLTRSGGLWRVISPWLQRMERAMTKLGRDGQLWADQPDGTD